MPTTEGTSAAEVREGFHRLHQVEAATLTALAVHQAETLHTLTLDLCAALGIPGDQRATDLPLRHTDQEKARRIANRLRILVEADALEVVA